MYVFDGNKGDFRREFDALVDVSFFQKKYIDMINSTEYSGEKRRYEM